MLSVKALLALSTTGLGAAALGVAGYVSTNPLAFTGDGSPPVVTPVNTETAVKPEAPPTPAVEMPAVAVTSNPATKPARRVQHRAAKKETLQNCSDWRTLETGRQGRHVRVLCQPKSAHAGS